MRDEYVIRLSPAQLICIKLALQFKMEFEEESNNIYADTLEWLDRIPY